MMRDRDFILRYIKLFFELVAKALGLFEKKDLVLAEQTIDLAFRQFIGYPPTMLESMTPAGLMAVLSTDADRKRERLLLAGELLRCQALITHQKGDLPRAIRAASHARFLFLEASNLTGLPDLVDFRESFERLADFCGQNHVPDPSHTKRLRQLGEGLQG